jgi:hypothetical protein
MPRNPETISGLTWRGRKGWAALFVGLAVGKSGAMSDYREECIRHKNVQRGIEEERPVGTKKKAGRKRYLIESKWFNQWGWSGRYETMEVAQQAFDQKSRKHPHTGWRIVLNGEVLRTYEPPAA